MHLTSFQRDDRQAKFVALVVLLLFFFLILLGRMWYLQIFHGRKWRVFSEANRVEIKREPPIRGRVLDRKGRVISESRPSFDLILKPTKMGPKPEEVVEDVLSFLDLREEDPAGLWDQIRNAGPGDTVVLEKDVTRDRLGVFMANQFRFPGAEVQVTPARNYPFGKHGSHFLGYLGEISRPELKKAQEAGDTDYQMGDVWGISGVEKSFEDVLRGVHGSVPMIVNAFGHEIGPEFAHDLIPNFRRQDPVSGEDLVLTIDSDVQKAAEESFVNPSGAVVAMDPRNGDILALFSKPQFEPEKFARGVSRDYWLELHGDTQNPLYDRSLRGQYPPGSTFKMVTGLAALMEGVTKPDEKIYCPGYYVLGNEVKKCWNHKGHGEVDFHKALVQSCDVYFYEMGRRLGVDRIAKYANQFGLGEPTGIAINREKSGLVPTEQWKKDRFGVRWVGGETLSVAIGQGFLNATPIQMAVMVAGLVNGGMVMEPRIAMRAQSFGGDIKKTYPSKVRKTFTMDADAQHRIMKALEDVVNTPAGTAYWSARSEKIRIAGKTGTAQVVSLKSRVKLNDHAWFVAFAPAEKPEIVVSAIVEYGGHGGTTAAPIAKRIIETYLGGEHETGG